MARSVTYKTEDGGETTFHINKLPAPRLKHLLLKHVLPVIGAAGKTDVVKDSPDWAHALRAILAIVANFDADNYRDLTEGLYSGVSYLNGTTVTKATPLAGDQDNAFWGLDVVHLLELDYQVLAENFTSSLAVIRSLHPSLAPILDWLASQTSTLSSDIQSSIDSPDTKTSTA